MDVTLPNGQVIRGVPEGTSKEVIMQKAIASGLAMPEDFANVMPAPAAPPSQEKQFASPRARRAYQSAAEEARKESLLASLPEGQREVIESLSPLEAFMVGMGKGFTNIGRGIGLVDQPTDEQRQSFDVLQEYAQTATAARLNVLATGIPPAAMAAGTNGAACPSISPPPVAVGAYSCNA